MAKKKEGWCSPFLSLLPESLRPYPDYIIQKPLDSLLQALSIVMIFGAAFMVWKSFVWITACKAPIVVVLSGSMEPAFHRGDVLILTHRHKIEVGDIPVFKLEDREIPIVHRVLRYHRVSEEIKNSGKSESTLLTKGDNNYVDDIELYPMGQKWLKDKDTMGQTIAFIPQAGLLTIWLNENQFFRYMVISLMVIIVCVTGE